MFLCFKVRTLKKKKKCFPFGSTFFVKRYKFVQVLKFTSEHSYKLQISSNKKNTSFPYHFFLILLSNKNLFYVLKLLNKYKIKYQIYMYNFQH